MKDQTKLPFFRTEDLVIQELPNELLIYDLEKNKAFCLNETALLIIGECNGQTSIDEAVINLNRKLKVKVSAEMIWLVVEQLKKFDLLKDDYQLPVQTTGITRRKILQSAAALGISLPLITCLVAPTAVQAQSESCVMINGVCTPLGPFNDNCCLGGTSIGDIVVGRTCIGCSSGGNCNITVGMEIHCCPGQTCFAPDFFGNGFCVPI